MLSLSMEVTQFAFGKFRYFHDKVKLNIYSQVEDIFLMQRYLLCRTPFYKIIVPTVDTVRYNFLISHLVNASCPVMMVGPVGTGKTSVAQEILTSLDPKNYSVLTINMSAQVNMSLYST